MEALGQFRALASGYPIAWMATVKEIRHANLLTLIQWAGSTQGLADLTGKSHSQLSQLRNQVVHSTTKKPRTIGDSLAREIERSIGESEGWMDSLQQAPSIAFAELAARKGGAQVTQIKPEIASQFPRSLAHPVSYQSFDHPLLNREQLMTMAELPARFTFALDDEAMGELGRAGTEVLFHKAADAKVGAGVLVRDQAGALHVRRKAQGRSDQHWLAVAPNPMYRTLDSEADGLTILAVWRGVVNRGLEDA